MPDFKKRRQLARLLNRSAKQVSELPDPPSGWIMAMRQALNMSAEHVARRKGVSRNAVYQAERSEKEGAVSLKQMDRLAKAMGGRFVYAIVPDESIETLKYDQALRKAQQLSQHERGFERLSRDDKQDWLDDTVAELLHDMPPDFWD